MSQDQRTTADGNGPAAANGHSPREAAPPKEMSITQAAEFLDVERPQVVRWVRRGVLPCRKVGTRRRIPYDALVARRSEMTRKAHLAADEMVRLSQELGLYDTDAPADPAK